MTYVLANDFALNKDNSSNPALATSIPHLTSDFLGRSKGNQFTFTQFDHSSKHVDGYIVYMLFLTFTYI